MAGLNEEAQWIMLMGFIVAIALFFLAVVIDESTLVGQTTAESVLDFSKSDIIDTRSEILEVNNFEIDATYFTATDYANVKRDIKSLTLYRKHAIVDFNQPDSNTLVVHYNNGLTKYDETITLY